MFILGASAKAWGRGRKIVGGSWGKRELLCLHSDRNKQFLMLPKKNYWAKTVVANILPAPKRYCRLLHQCWVLLVHGQAHHRGLKEAVAQGQPSSRPWPPSAVGLVAGPVFSLPLPHKPASLCLTFCFHFWLQEIMLKAAGFPHSSGQMWQCQPTQKWVYTNSEGDSCHIFLKIKVLCCSIFILF